MANRPVYVDNELFLGRLDEQERFRETLHTVLTARDDEAPPFIFLLHGEGGMGKSQLTRRLYDIATMEAPFERDCQALRVDWELIRNNTPALRVAREQIHPEEVLAALHRAALDQGWDKHFETYQKVLRQREQAEQEVAKALEQQKEGGQYILIRDLGASGLAKLVRLALPVFGQTGEDLGKALLVAGIQLGAEQIAKGREQAEQFLKVRLKPELYDVYRQPHEQLARALGDAFHRVSRERPLVLLLDTYEIVSPVADTWLRTTIRTAGPRVVWVIAGRDNLAASRPGDRYVGYSAEFPRRLTVWDIQELAIEYIQDYLHDRAPIRPAIPEEAAALHRATLGVPLVLRLATDLWAKGMELAAITEGIPDYAPREELVRLMCERVLMHLEQEAAGEADRYALYTLAMQPRPDTEVQTTLLQPADDTFDLHARLAQLTRRYSAVRLAGGAHLHPAMAEFVREYLLRTGAGDSDRIKMMAKQAIEKLLVRRTKLEEDLFDPSERVESEDWQQNTLDLMHWLFWHDEQAAWRELIPRFVEGLGYDLDLARSLLELVEHFKPKLSNDGRKRLKRLQLTPDNRENMLNELERLARKGHWLDSEDTQLTVERQIILLLWRGRWQAEQGQLNEALQTYLSAERRLPTEATDLRLRLSEAFYQLSDKLLWPVGAQRTISSEAALQATQRAVALDMENGGAWYNLGLIWKGLGDYEKAIDAYQKAIELDPRQAALWNSLGNLRATLSHYREAIHAFEKAIELDPKDAYPWNGLGNVYDDLGQYQEAIQAYQQAIKLDSKDAHPWNGLGNIYEKLARHQEAIEAYQKAIELDPNYAFPWSNLGNIYRGLGRYDEAIKAYQKAIELNPEYVSPWMNLGIIYRELGQKIEAERHLTQARRLIPADAYYDLASLEAISGKIDSALEYLAKALIQIPGATDWARSDPDLASLRDHPRFKELLR